MTIFTPWCSPWVSDNPVVNTSGSSSVTDSDYCMILTGTTTSSRDYAAWVEVEIIACSTNSNCNGTFVKCSFQSLWVLWSNHLIWLNLCDTSSCFCFAGLCISCIWIINFTLDWCHHCILKDPVWPSTTASLVTRNMATIDNLLLRHVNEGSCLNCMSTLYSANSSKSIATTAVSLVLNSIYYTFCPPINRCSKCLLWIICYFHLS